jgi:hypothetical protein
MGEGALWMFERVHGVVGLGAVMLGLASCASQPGVAELRQRVLPAPGGLACSGYAAWNHGPVADVLLTLAGTGTGSIAFVHETSWAMLDTRRAAYLTFDKPGVSATFGDPAAVRIEDEPFKRHTQGSLLGCAREALRFSDELFGSDVRWHFRGHSEGVLILLSLYDELLAKHPAQAQRVRSLVLSGVPLEPFAEILRRQLADKPLLAQAVANCDDAILKQRLGTSCLYLADAKARPSGFELFERLAARRASTEFHIFHGSRDVNTPARFVRQLESWNAERGHLDITFHHFEGGHAGTPEVKRELSALLTSLAPDSVNLQTKAGPHR